METNQKPSLTPRFFFISLGVLVALITSVASFLVLFFETLNKRFPDALEMGYQAGYNAYSYDSIRGTLSTLIIFFPVFLILSYYWRKISKVSLGIKDTIIFKWMIYLIIFLSSLVIIIDLVTLVQYFVSGEITARFIYKVLGAGLVAALVGFNYFFELKNHDVIEPSRRPLIHTVVAVILFLGLITWSFAIMGSPAKQRAWRLDGTRVNDLQNIQSQIISYWQQKEKLPENLSDLSNPIMNNYLPVDPEYKIGRLYEYKIIDKLSFELCATFTLATPIDPVNQAYNRAQATPVVTTDKPLSTSSLNDSWTHGEGRTCFSRTIDKDIYPPNKK